MIKYLVFFGLLLSGCAPILKWQTEYPDNYLEEYVEELIKDKSDKDIDLSPFTGVENQKFNQKQSI